MVEDKDLFIIYCIMTDTTHRKQDMQVYVATYVKDLVRDDMPYNRNWLVVSIIKMLQALSKGVNKKMKENPNFLVSHMKADIIKKETKKLE